MRKTNSRISKLRSYKCETIVKKFEVIIRNVWNRGKNPYFMFISYLLQYSKFPVLTLVYESIAALKSLPRKAVSPRFLPFKASCNSFVHTWKESCNNININSYRLFYKYQRKQFTHLRSYCIKKRDLICSPLVVFVSNLFQHLVYGS